jgi:Uncharacterized conserved protein (DUF2075)
MNTDEQITKAITNFFQRAVKRGERATPEKVNSDELIAQFITNLGRSSFHHLKRLFVKNRSTIWLGKPVKGGAYSGIDDVSLFMHFLVTGGTGSGKSGILINTATQAIDNPKLPQVLLLDPNAETALKVAKKIRYPNKTKLLSLEYKKDGISFICGYNPIFTLEKEQIEKEVIALQNILFDEAVKANNYNIMNVSTKVLETGLTFHLALIDFWSRKKLVRTKQDLKVALRDRQLTLRDLGTITDSQESLESFQALFTTVFKDHSPKLFEFWSQDLSKLQYLPNVCQRIGSISCNPATKYFFESKGYDLIEFIDKGYNILCPLTGLQDNSLLKDTISKLLFNQILSHYQKNTDFETGNSSTNPLLLLIDEAKVIEFDDMSSIIEQARKYKIGLGLFAQRENQFTKKTQKAFDLLANKVELRQNVFSDNLPDRVFRHYGKNSKAADKEKDLYQTLDYPKDVRQKLFYSLGISKLEISAKIAIKEKYLNEFFLNPTKPLQQYV